MDNILQKHCDFWERAPGSVLIGEIPFSGWRLKPFPTRRGEIIKPTKIDPDDIDPNQYVGAGDALAPVFTGDMVNYVRCKYPECWLEGMIGCDVYASEVSLSSKPIPTEAGSFPDISPDAALRSSWARLFADTQRAAVEKADGKLGAAQLHLRGVIDMLAAALGESELCLAAYEHPQELATLAAKCAATLDRAADITQKLIPRWNGGRVSCWYVYAPGDLIDYQIDASSLFSPEMYRKQFLPFDRKILKKHKYNVVHLHSCGLLHVPGLAETEDVRAVEINLDKETGGYCFDRIANAIKDLQHNDVSVIIHGELSRDEVEDYLSVSQPRGLAIFHWLPLN